MTAVGAPLTLTGRLGCCVDCRCRTCVRFSLPTDSSSVPLSRRLVAKALSEWGLSGYEALRQTALLVLSELVTNSVRHAAPASPEVDITVTLLDDALTLAVHDRHPHRPTALPRPHPDGSGGWGLRLVKTLAAELGGTTAVPADQDGRGKTVLVRLPLRETDARSHRTEGQGERTAAARP